MKSKQRFSDRLLANGTKIDRYRIIEKIGVGGMAEVYSATDDKLKRKVALKFLLPNLATEEVIKARFIREAQSAAALNHPNIITIYEVSEWGGEVFIAMEFLAGKSLRQLLDEGSIGYTSSLEITIQVCQGLQEAHTARIIHRDIKPGNIVLDSAGKVKILDFGLAIFESDDRLTKSGIAVGTVDYMSPEQARGREVDQRSDIFSVAVLFYEMLAGRSPFKRDNLPATINAIVSEQPKPKLKLNCSVSRNIESIFNKALAKDVKHRYQSVSDMLVDLKGLQDGHLVQPVTLLSIGDSQPSAISLAVLYLKNIGSADDEFLSYGITEDLIVDLTRISTIRVPPMRKILKYKDSNEELEAIAEKLNVNLVLDGSIHKSKNKIRISAHLVDVRTGENLWAERWEESATNLPQIKQALAQGVAQALEVGSSVLRRVEVGTPEVHNPQAYEYYLRGKYTFEQKKNTSDPEIALGMYQKALELEPSLLAARAGIANILVYRGENDLAHQELVAVLTDAREQDAKTDEAVILRIMARLETAQSHWELAREHAQLARELSSTLGDLAGEAETLGILIRILELQAKLPDALILFERVLEINRQLDDQQQAAEALKSMGFVHIRVGEYERGQKLTQEALEIARRQKDKSLEALCIKNIGIAYEFMGKLDLARQHYGQAWQLCDELGDERGKAANLNNTGNVLAAQGSYRKALEYYSAAAAIQKKISDPGTYALSYNNLSFPLTILGEYEKAIKISLEALAIVQELDYKLVIHDAYNALGFAYFCQCEYRESKQHFNAALNTAEEGNLRRGIAMTLSHQAEMHFHLGDYDLCSEQSQKALTLAEKIGDKEFQLKAEAYLAAAMVHRGDFDTGVKRLGEVLTAAENHDDPRYIIAVQRLLGQTQIVCGLDESQHNQGRTILEKALEFAEAKEIAYEIMWIKKILEKDKAKSLGMRVTVS